VLPQPSTQQPRHPPCEDKQTRRQTSPAPHPAST
jgi:hypothetical protein